MKTDAGYAPAVENRVGRDWRGARLSTMVRGS